MDDIVAAKPLLRKKEIAAKRYFSFVQLSFSKILVVLAMIYLLFMLICVLFPRLIAPYEPTDMNMSSIMQPPSVQHYFGTDYFGRDIFSLVVHGSRDSLLIGFASVIVGVLFGGAIGAAAGYIGGKLDSLLMRLIDVLMTIPGILLALAIAGALGPSLFNIVIAIAISSIPGYARVMRAQIMSINSRTYIIAARAIGVKPIAIFFKHVLPNALSPLLVMSTIGIGTAILAGSGLSFLGLGVLKEIPDWGTLLAQGRGYLTIAWWICTFPGLAITLFVLAINIIGDYLRDYLDPKNRYSN